ncbi:nucleotidyltransferase family protein [Paenibacillus arenilitoris]|uniref:NTP transferase domain-containing protein n=1 Tax=Paenibacillus arenilitoris TaxID=2772299 RepID=A0A927H7L7_9BACL|nr:NTP transferase domain-containing protein [Paenibacillus arenilitoris]MBD2871160.1 NTP transferase domain-containing protein [Paenibacillus arenilitoris]
MRKQAMELSAGIPLGSLGLRALLSSRLDGVAVVVRPDDPLNWLESIGMEAAAVAHGAGAAPRIVVCAEAERGMAFSIRRGLEDVLEKRPETEAVVIALADQPFITADMIDELICRWREHPRLDYVATAGSDDGRGEPLLLPPALLNRSMFEALRQLEGDAGARGLFRSSRYRGRGLPAPSGKTLLDVDTLRQYDLACRLLLDETGLP